MFLETVILGPRHETWEVEAASIIDTNHRGNVYCSQAFYLIRAHARGQAEAASSNENEIAEISRTVVPLAAVPAHGRRIKGVARKAVSIEIPSGCSRLYMIPAQ